MSRARLAERLWAASQSDPVLAENLRAAWPGPLDVQDVLWWHAHPLAPTPAGAPDPAAALRPLQAVVYSRPQADAEHPTGPGPAAEERLGVLMEERAVHAQAVEELLDAFADWTVTGPSLPATGRLPARTDGPRIPVADAGVRAAQPRPPARSRRWTSLILVAGGLAVGVLGTLGVQALGPTTAHRNAPLTSVDVDESRTTLPFAPATDDPIDATGTDAIDSVFQIFTQPPLFLTQPLPALGSDIVPESVREIATFHSYATYAAMNFDGDYCLIIHGFADDISVSGCSRATQVRASGQRVDTTIESLPGDPEFTDLIEVRLTWLPDGTFQTDVAATHRP